MLEIIARNCKKQENQLKTTIVEARENSPFHQFIIAIKLNLQAAPESSPRFDVAVEKFIVADPQHCE